MVVAMKNCNCSIVFYKALRANDGKSKILQMTFFWNIQEVFDFRVKKKKMIRNIIWILSKVLYILSYLFCYKMFSALIKDCIRKIILPLIEPWGYWLLANGWWLLKWRRGGAGRRSYWATPPWATLDRLASLSRGSSGSFSLRHIRYQKNPRNVLFQ